MYTLDDLKRDKQRYSQGLSNGITYRNPESRRKPKYLEFPTTPKSEFISTPKPTPAARITPEPTPIAMPNAKSEKFGLKDVINTWPDRLKGEKPVPVAPFEAYQFKFPVMDNRLHVSGTVQNQEKRKIVGESKNNYYFRDGVGNLNAIPKSWVSTKPLENIEELKGKSEDEVKKAIEKKSPIMKGIERFQDVASSAALSGNYETPDTGSGIANALIDVVGSLGGLLAPNPMLGNSVMVASSKAGQALENKVAQNLPNVMKNQAIRKAIEGAGTFGAMGGYGAMANNESLGGVAKKVIQDSAIGGVSGVATELLPASVKESLGKNVFGRVALRGTPGALALGGIGAAEAANSGMSGKEILAEAGKGALTGFLLNNAMHGMNKLGEPKPVKSEISKNNIESKPIESQKPVPGEFIGKNTATNLYAVHPDLRPKLSETKGFKFENPEIEAIHQQNKGVPNHAFFEKTKEGVSKIVNLFRRPISSLPVNKENAELYKELIKLPKVKEITSDNTIRVLNDVTNGLDKNTFDLFSRKVLLDDLAQDVKLGNKLPNEFTPEIVTRELERINSNLPESIVNSLEKRKTHWETIKKEYTEAMKDIGVDVSDKFTREDYFHHQVLDHMDSKRISSTGDKLKTPVNRGFSKARSGEYTGNINTDYLQSEYEVMAQMKHDIEIAKTVKNIETNYDISEKVKLEAKKQGLEDWREAIPEGYTTWQPKEGNVFYQADTLPSKVTTGLLEGTLKEAKLTPDEIRKVLAIGGKNKEFVVKQEVADTLSNLFKNKPTNALSSVSKTIQSKWKAWVLTVNPRSFFKYNIRNFSGDLDPIITGNPGTLKKVPRASRELFNAYRHDSFTPELKSWYDRGGFQELLYAQEIGDVNTVKPFERFKNKTVGDVLKKPLKTYLNATKKITNYREAVGRYATYLDYIEQMKKNGGLPKNYGASKPEVIKGLKTIEDRAYKLSNDLLGAYDEVSEGGQVLRNHLIPFYSWLEVNLKRYKQLGVNAVKSEKTTEKIGRSFLVGASATGKVAYNVGKLFLKAFILTSAIAAWNSFKYPDLEDTLPDDVKAKPHLILGKDKDGNTLYFSRLGSLNDFGEWLGLDTPLQDLKDIMNGTKTFKEQVNDMLKSPANKVLTGIRPEIKTTTEYLTGQKFYPDVFKPSPIRDKPQYVAQSLNIRSEYDAIAGKPHRPYFESLQEAILYKARPVESAYYKVLDLKSKYKKKRGDSGEGFFQSPRSNALYNYKLALKYKDENAAKKYYDKYIELGGTTKGMNKSVQSMDPLYGLNKQEKSDFIKGLTPREIAQLNLAKDYYKEILESKDVNNRK